MPMKILIVSDARSIHTKRWVAALSKRGIEVILYSITLPEDNFYENESIKNYCFDFFSYKKRKGNIFCAVRNHLKAVRDLKGIITNERPDILHAHYLTGYSFIAALTGFHPFLVSAWGSDIYEFPKQSAIKKWSVKFILRCADTVLATSRVLAKECGKYTGKAIGITPFGVDTELFRPSLRLQAGSGPFIIGTAKTLSHKYGIDLLIKTFRLVCENNPDKDCRLEIAGSGPDSEKLQNLAYFLGVGDKVSFLGHIPNNELADIFNHFNVAIYLSRQESFGVSAIEAMSCGKPVVTSAAPGFTEVVENSVCGFIIDEKDENTLILQASKAVQKFIDTPALERSMGEKGRERVERLYKWDNNVTQMISIYKSVLERR